MFWVLNMPRFWMYQDYICYSYKRFWIKYFIVYIWQGSEYIAILNHARVLNILGFWICQDSLKKTLHHRYLTGFKMFLRFCKRVLNMPDYTGFLKKMLYHRCMTGFQLFFRFWIWLGYKYARAIQGSEQNTPLKIFD